MTYMNLEAVYKKPEDGIELCQRGITQRQGLNKEVHKIPQYKAFNYSLLPFKMQNIQ